MLARSRFPGLVHPLWPFIVWFTDGIFAEDRRIVEEEQRVFELRGAGWNQEIFPIIRALTSLLIRQGVPLAGAS